MRLSKMSAELLEHRVDIWQTPYERQPGRRKPQITISPSDTPNHGAVLVPAPNVAFHDGETSPELPTVE